MPIGLYTLSEQIQAVGSNKWPTQPAAGDPYFNYVTLLLHGDGTNSSQNNTFIDSSTNNFSITRNGNTTQGSFSPYSNEWSCYFDGTGDYLTIADNTAFEFGSSNYTIECWINTTTTSNKMIASKTTTGGGANWSWLFQINVSSTTGNVHFYAYSYNTTNPLLATGNININDGSWHHIAVTRSGTSHVLYVDGASQATATASFTYSDTTHSIVIGEDLCFGPRSWEGYISNFRIINGSDAYTTTFSPPTEPLTAITNTSLLACKSNRFIDTSTNAFSITRVGDTSITNFSPHLPVSAYTTGVNSGGAYFDGTGDYLTIADNTNLRLPTEDFTLECWAYFTSLPASTAAAPLIHKGVVASSNFEYALQVYNNAGTIRLRLACSTNGSSTTILDATSGDITTNQWYHIAATRTGTNATVWLNGTNVGSTTSFASTIFGGTAALGIGGNSTGSAVLSTGYISNIRIVKGTRIYTAAFSPPSSPVTAVTNTQLLLNFTNGAIFDNGKKAAYETIGNTQISTTQKKFGSASLYFDGTGDYLSAASNHIFDINKDFTIELWAYFNTLSGTQIMVARQGTVGGDGLFQFRANGSTLEFVICANGSTSVTTVTTGSILTTTTWTHLAVTRSGSTIRLFVNGTLSQTGTSGVSATSTTRPLTVGCLNDFTPSYFTNAYIDDLRITKGVARYTASFTPPTSAYEDL